MPCHHRLALIAASVFLLAPPVARAQKDVASCKPVLDGVLKQRATPFHEYGTVRATSAGGKPMENEMIATGGQYYILMGGQWKKSPMDQAAMVKQEQENIRDAKALSCHRLRSESVDGVPAVVYAEHSEDEDTKSDGQVWVATVTGLILRTELDMSTTDGGGTDHSSARFEYTNVQVPAGVK